MIDATSEAGVFLGRVAYYSSPNIRPLNLSLGAQHYSYGFAASKFTQALESEGMDLLRLGMPEYYSIPEALPSNPDGAPPGDKPVHLIFRSTEEIRLLKFGYNVVCFAWEFDILKDVTKANEHPFENQVRMLRICDEVWVPCTYTRDVLHRYNVNNVHVIPAPIEVKKRTYHSSRRALASLGSVTVCPMNHNNYWSGPQHVAENTPLVSTIASSVDLSNPNLDIFISVLNPEDDRKNLNAMLRGFYYYHQKNPNAVLIIKLVTSLKRYNKTPGELMIAIVQHKLIDKNIIQCPSILLIPDYLTPEQLDAFYQMADFYLCTSIAEGQNLPLLEAMAYGVIPVSPRHTAMADYLEDDNSIEIRSRKIPNFLSNLGAASFGKDFEIDYCDERDVLAALTDCDKLSKSERSRLSQNALAATVEHFSPEFVTGKIAERLQAI